MVFIYIYIYIYTLYQVYIYIFFLLKILHILLMQNPKRISIGLFQRRRIGGVCSKFHIFIPVQY